MGTYQKGALLDLDSIAWRKRKAFGIVLGIDTSSREKKRNARHKGSLP
jgi:hypothetical protein